MKVVVTVTVFMHTYGKGWEKVENYRRLNWRKCPERGKKVFSLLFLGCLVLSVVFHHLLKTQFHKAEELGCSFHIQPNIKILVQNFKLSCFDFVKLV